MAIRRSVVAIDVQDEKWSAYLASFTKYNTMLATMPKNWQSAAKGTKEQVEATDKLKTIVSNNLANLRAMAANQNEMTNKSRSMAMYWKDIVKSTKESATNTYQQVTHLLRATGIVSAVTGLALGGGVFGLDRLAASASNDRRLALGLGVNYGHSAGFNVGFGRAIDTQTFLHGVARGRGSMTSNAATAMRIMGMDPRAKGDTGDVSDALLERIRALALQAKQSGEYGQAVEINRTEEFGIGTEDLRRIGAYSPKEWQEFKSNQAKANLGVDDGTQKKWEDFYVALGLAGDKLKTGLLNGLVALQGPLTKFTDEFSKFVESLLGSKGFKEVVEDFAAGLKRAGEYVSTDKFKSDLEDFGKKIMDVYHWFVKLDDWFSNSMFGKMIGSTSTDAKNVNDAINNPGSLADRMRKNRAETWQKWSGGASGVGDWFKSWFKGTASGAPAGGSSTNDYLGRVGSGMAAIGSSIAGALGPNQGNIRGGIGANNGPGLPGSMSKEEMVQKLMALGWTQEQAIGIAANLMAESSGQANAVGDGGLAYGLAQWHPDRQAQFKKLFGKDIRQSTAAEQLQFVDWELRNTEVAAGMRLKAATERGAAAAIVSQHYERPAAVQEAANNRAADARGGFGGIGGQPGGGQGPGVKVTINNNTGGNANPIVSQLGIVPQ